MTPRPPSLRGVLVLIKQTNNSLTHHSLHYLDTDLKHYFVTDFVTYYIQLFLLPIIFDNDKM